MSLAAELVVPDPRTQTVPAGWWESYALPVVNRAETFDELDEIQWRVQAVADYLDVVRIDRFEFEAALRVIEVRRGELLGDGRRRRNLPRVEDATDSSDATRSRWRTLAAHWDDIVKPALAEGGTWRDISQAKLLKRCESAGELVAKSTVAEQRQDPSPVPEAARRRAVIAMAEAMWDERERFAMNGVLGLDDDDWPLIVQFAEIAWGALEVGPGGRWRVRALEGDSG